MTRPPHLIATILVVSLTSGFCGSQQLDFEVAGRPVTTAPADPAISARLQQVQPARMRRFVEQLVRFGTRNTLSSMETDLKPGEGVLPAAAWIHEEFAEIAKECGGCLEVKDDVFTYTPPVGKPSRYKGPTKLQNVYAVMRGSDPAQARRMYLVTGHYDTRNSDTLDEHGVAPGANDDASGTAVSLECARVLAGMRLPATVVFVAVAGEEQGLNGSHHLAEMAKAEGWELEGVLNNDIVGGDTTPGETLQSKERVRVFSQGLLPTEPAEVLREMLLAGSDNDTPSRELARMVLGVGATYTEMAGAKLQPVMELRLDRYLRGGDHSSFSADGFPAVRFTEWRENFNHQHQDVRMVNGIQYGDLISFDDFEYRARVARLNAATLAVLASSPGVPRDVHVVTRALDNDTTLVWTAPESPGTGLHYEILWRQTAANDWEYIAPADRYPRHGDAGLGATLPISKDNVFFGVRACDRQEHCSQAVPPTPER